MDIESRYIIVGKEVGECGTPHLQGYIEWDNARSLASVKSKLPRAHLEIARGNSAENEAYCKKDNEIFREEGERSLTSAEKGESEKTRWKNAWEGAKSGDWDAVDDDIKVRYYNAMKSISKDYMPKATDVEEVTGYWYVGEPGTGKSHAARAEGDYYDKPCNKWWDGYKGEDIVIVDDLDSSHLGHLLKRWGDKYGFPAETKGGGMHIRPKKIIVTSNYTIDELWGYGSKEPNIAMCNALKDRYKVTRFTFKWRAPR